MACQGHIVVAMLLVLTAPRECFARKKAGKSDDGSDRMQMELDVDGTAQQVQSAEMAAEEAKAKAGLAAEFTDALTDVMGEISLASASSCSSLALS